jgi:hypothetical protein
MRVEVSGMQEILDELQGMGEAGVRVGLQVLGDAAKEIAAKARPLVPVDDVDGGQLRDSVRTSKPNRTKAGRISAGVVAGGAPLRKVMGRRKANIYAVVQHEDLTLRHRTGGAKFLERPGNDVAPKIPDRLVAGMDAERFGAR